MDISVIVPTYKPGYYLWECLDSLAAQTFGKDRYEVIVVLNGCCEPYLNRLKSYVADNASGTGFKLLHTNEPGVSNARNMGLDVATGAHILFVDDDDYLSANCLEAMFDTASTGDMPICRRIDFKEGCTPSKEVPQPTGRYVPGTVSGKLRMSRLFNNPVCKLIPYSAIGTRRFDRNFTNGEDGLFMVLISDRIGNLRAASERALYYRRQREGSLSFKARPTGWRIRLSAVLFTEYLRIYFRHPSHYNLPFIICRCSAEIKQIVFTFFRN